MLVPMNMSKSFSFNTFINPETAEPDALYVNLVLTNENQRTEAEKAISVAATEATSEERPGLHYVDDTLTWFKYEGNPCVEFWIDAGGEGGFEGTETLIDSLSKSGLPIQQIIFGKIME